MVPQARPLILSFYTSLLFGADDWYLSYRIRTDNFIPFYEHLYLSRAMVPFEGSKRRLCRFPFEGKDFKTFVQTHSQQLLECLFRTGIVVRGESRIDRLTAQNDRVTLILPPIPLKVEINDGLVTIYEVRSKK